MTPHLANTPVIETERLILRAPVAGDWEPWCDFALSERAQYIGGPYNLRWAWRGFGHVIGMWVLRGYGSFVITKKGDDTGIGSVGPWNPADWPERELGWTIWSADCEGKGYAIEAAMAARHYAFDTLGWDDAVSYIDAPNTRSIKLAERLGARLDPDAERPAGDDPDKPVLVYRHAKPGGPS